MDGKNAQIAKQWTDLFVHGGARGGHNAIDTHRHAMRAEPGRPVPTLDVGPSIAEATAALEAMRQLEAAKANAPKTLSGAEALEALEVFKGLVNRR